VEAWANRTDRPLPVLYIVEHAGPDPLNLEDRITIMNTLSNAQPPISDQLWDDMDFACYCSTAKLLKESQREPARATFTHAVREAEAQRGGRFLIGGP
jgi:hypothetical protein